MLHVAINPSLNIVSKQLFCRSNLDDACPRLIHSFFSISLWNWPRPGAIVAALTDLTFNARGYAAVLGNNLLTALYLIMVKHTPAASELSTTGTRSDHRKRKLILRIYELCLQRFLLALPEFEMYAD